MEALRKTYAAQGLPHPFFTIEIFGIFVAYNKSYHTANRQRIGVSRFNPSFAVNNVKYWG